MCDVFKRFNKLICLYVDWATSNISVYYKSKKKKGFSFFTLDELRADVEFTFEDSFNSVQ